MNVQTRWAVRFLLLVAVAATSASPAWSRLRPEDPEYQDLKAYEEEVMARANPTNGRGRAGRFAIPDIFNAGAVLNVGNVVMKVTNNGIIGNPFTAISSDPSCQWPGASAVEYMNFAGIALGAGSPDDRRL